MVVFAGGDNDGPWFLPDILVTVRRSGDDAVVGVIREMLLVCICLLERRICDCLRFFNGNGNKDYSQKLKGKKENIIVCTNKIYAGFLRFKVSLLTHFLAVLKHIGFQG